MCRWQKSRGTCVAAGWLHPQHHWQVSQNKLLEVSSPAGPWTRTMADARAGQPQFCLASPEDPRGQRAHSLPGCPVPPASCCWCFLVLSLALPRPPASCETPWWSGQVPGWGKADVVPRFQRYERRGLSAEWWSARHQTPTDGHKSVFVIQPRGTEGSCWL